MAETENHDGDSKVGLVESHSQKLDDDLKKIGLKIKHHEDNLKLLNAQLNNIDESILDLQVSRGKYHSSMEAEEGHHISLVQTEQNTIDHILQQEKTAAGIICQLKNRYGMQASKLLLIKDVLGVVATLGQVNDNNLSRLLSEFLGLENMMAIVCKTYEGVKALERYDKEGVLDKSFGLHGLGLTIGRVLDGRFLVFCLENLRPYTGEIISSDPQKKLSLLNPRLPNGEPPPGFLGFAVNMIILDHMQMSCLTPGGHGLRETLFYSLFSRLQVYKTRAQMQLAIPYISDGAISLDGGMIKGSGVFLLGDRKDVEVRFPVSSGTSILPTHIIEIEEQVMLMNWRKERLIEDMQREEQVLNHTKGLFNSKKQDILMYLKQTRSCFPQIQPVTGRG